VLPGTLLALVPGVIFGIQDQFPEKSEGMKEISYFKRYDDTVIDFSEKIPYPFEFGRGFSLFFIRKYKKCLRKGLIEYHKTMIERKEVLFDFI
jgi:hypothetical protein